VSNSNFEYGPLASGIYIAMLWFTLIVAVIDPYLLKYYAPLLLFLGLGLKPFLIKTGLAAKYQALTAIRKDRQNSKMRKGFYTRHPKKLEKRDKHIANMREKMRPKG
jgi:hypothetical protein